MSSFLKRMLSFIPTVEFLKYFEEIADVFSINNIKRIIIFGLKKLASFTETKIDDKLVDEFEKVLKANFSTTSLIQFAIAILKEIAKRTDNDLDDLAVSLLEKALIST